MDCKLKKKQLRPTQSQINSVINLYSTGQIEKTLDALKILTSKFPDEAWFYNISGACYAELDQLEKAVKHYNQALRTNPQCADTLNNLGVAFIKLSQVSAGIKSFEQALVLKPDSAEAHNNLGKILNNIGQLEKARKHLNQALKIKPHYSTAHCNLGNTFSKLGQSDAALRCYEQALAIKPDYIEAQLQKLHQQSLMCDWRLWSGFLKIKDSNSITGPHVCPFILLPFEDKPKNHHIRSKHYANKIYTNKKSKSFIRPKVKPTKLRIAYFSSDFFNHATMHLMAKLFKVHDKNNFEIFVYSYGLNNKDLIYDALVNNVNYLKDVRDKSDSEIFELVRYDKIDIAIDLKGYTENTRTSIFSFRLAPIQINYLGYPGTLGTDFIDYIIADDVVIAPEQRAYYSEEIIYLPHSYQVNDNTRPISEISISRAGAGLPEQAFVFCCFNNNYKISPQEFDIWMRLLKRVKGSVLWLLRSNTWAEINLHNEAEKRGITPERLIFADKMPPSDHLARHRLADLFLDTFNVNAHTTASDALWAGLPIVTKQGQGFAARVAASLLTAIGLPELITKTEEDYEALIFDLATNRIQLKVIKDKLAKNLHTYPLFNTELFARHLEDAYHQAYQIYFEGKKPQMIRVKEVTLPHLNSPKNICLLTAIISTASAFKEGDIISGYANLNKLLALLDSHTDQLTKEQVLTLKTLLSEALIHLKNNDYLALANILEEDIVHLLSVNY